LLISSSVQPRLEDLMATSTVADLAALVLAGHHDAARQWVTRTRVGHVDVLAAGALERIGVDARSFSST